MLAFKEMQIFDKGIEGQHNNGSWNPDVHTKLRDYH